MVIKITQFEVIPTKNGLNCPIIEEEIRINVNVEDIKSIEASEKKKTELENKGYYFKRTEQTGLNSFVLIYSGEFKKND